LSSTLGPKRFRESCINTIKWPDESYYYLLKASLVINKALEMLISFVSAHRGELLALEIVFSVKSNQNSIILQSRRLFKYKVASEEHTSCFKSSDLNHFVLSYYLYVEWNT
jgi:hypothetical protein